MRKHFGKLNPQIESVFAKEIKFIDDGEFTMLGTPYELIAMLQNEFVYEVQRIADTTPPVLLLNDIVSSFYVASKEEQ